MHKYLLLILILLPNLAIAASACKPRVLTKANKAEIADLISWLQKSKDEDTKRLAAYPDEMTVYLADIRNQGHPSYVVADVQGSGGYLSLEIFEKSGEEFKGPVDAPTPAEFAGRDGGWYEHGLFNIAKRRSELLVEICGTTYMNFSGSETGSNLGYVWKKDSTEHACGEDWAAYQLDLFQTQYDRKEYDLASNNLKTFFSTCKTALNAETRLRVLSNLTVTLAHMSDGENCANFVKEAKALPEFNKSPSKAGILHNAELCQASSAPSLDFKSAEEVSKAGLNDAILASTVPNLEFALNSYDTRAEKWLSEGVITKNRKMDSHRKFSLRDEVRKNLTGPAGDTAIVSPQIATITGCRAHSCGDQALLWIDTQSKVSAFVMNSFPFSESERECITIGSRTSSELSDEFWKSFHTWSKQAVNSKKCAYFVDGTKRPPTIHRIELH